jgi:hypothetical protein
MIDETTIQRLERRVSEVEKDLRSLRGRNLHAEVEDAKRLLFAHLQQNPEIDPVRFAAHNDLSLEAVELALEDFDKRGWTVPVDD